MGKGKKKQTVGYRYFCGMHLILCNGPIDKITKLTVDDKEAWIGSSTGGVITIKQPELFGGEEREGGVQGSIDVEMGRPDQGRNAYLSYAIGPAIPAYRGVVGLVFRDVDSYQNISGGIWTIFAALRGARSFYFGNSPYLKPWRARAQRIFVRQNGIAQWYPARAAIYPPILSASLSDWRYLVVSNSDNVNRSAPSFDDSSWLIGSAPFADRPWSYPGEFGFATVPGTVVPDGRKVWMRSTVSFNKVPGALRFEAFVDNDCRVYVNGVLALTLGGPNGAYYDVILPGSYFRAGENLVAVEGWDRHSGGGNWFWFDWRLSDASWLDMNPAHIIRECLTDPDWGMGYPEADIDEASFKKAADTLSAEGLGISMLWDKQTLLDDFIAEIIRHIDGCLYVDRQTGKFVLKLTRDDYVPGDLITLDPSNIEKIANPSRPEFGEMANSITVQFWDATTGKQDSITVQDPAGIQQQGAVINTTIQYPGFSSVRVGTIAAARDLRALSSPFLTCTIYTGEAGRDLNPGDVFKLTWPKWKLESVVMRVTGIALSDGKSDQVRISCVEDVFTTPLNAAVVAPPDGGWVDPAQPPAPITAGAQTLIEAPYYELLQAYTQTQVDAELAADHGLGYVFAAAGRPDRAINARLWTDAGPGYEDVANVDFSPHAVIVNAIGKTDSAFQIANPVDFDLITPGTFGQIGHELIRIDDIDPETMVMTVGRGVLDTPPEKHDAGSVIFFWDRYSGADPTQYTEGEVVLGKITATSGSGQTPLDDAEEMEIELRGRAWRPYSPGDLRVNGHSYSDEDTNGPLVITWRHRDRLQQTSATLDDHFAGDIGPEPGTTYCIRFYGAGVLIEEVDDISGTTETIQPDYAGWARLEVFAKRDGVYSLFPANHEFVYTPTGYGRLLQDDDERRTYDGELRITED